MKTLPAPVVTLLSDRDMPPFAVAVHMPSLGYRWTTVPEGVTLNGSAYSARVFKVEGIGDNMLAEVSAATLTVTSLADEMQAHVRDDEIRGEPVTVSLLVHDGSAWIESGRSWTFTMDADQADDREVVIRLASSDAVSGTAVPRRTTQEQGCQHDYQRGLCPFRYRVDVHPVSFSTCPKTFAACRERFPDVTIAGVKHVQPKPFGGFLGGVSARLVTR